MSNPRRPKAIPLTPPQIELLTDIATNPVMYIRSFSKWDRTARVLVRLGLATSSSDGYGDQYELRITEAAGKAEAARHGITCQQARSVTK